MNKSVSNQEPLYTLPTEFAGYGLLNTKNGQVYLFADVIERLNLTLGQFGYEVSAILDSVDALQSLAQLEKAIQENRNKTTEDVFYDLV